MVDPAAPGERSRLEIMGPIISVPATTGPMAGKLQKIGASAWVFSSWSIRLSQALIC